MNHSRCLFLAGSLSLLISGQAFADVFTGDFSNDHLAPTPFGVLEQGTHEVTGGVTGPNGNSTDFFSFEIGPGSRLTDWVLTEYINGDGGIFVAIADTTNATGDAIFPFASLGFNTTNAQLDMMRGGAVIAGATPAPDVMDAIGDPLVGVTTLNGLPFSTPGSAPLFQNSDYFVPAGRYAVMVQQTGGVATQYAFQFNVTAVPEPASCSLLAVGGAALATRRFSRRRRVASTI